MRNKRIVAMLLLTTSLLGACTSTPTNKKTSGTVKGARSEERRVGKEC